MMEKMPGSLDRVAEGTSIDDTRYDWSKIQMLHRYNSFLFTIRTRLGSLVELDYQIRTVSFLSPLSP